MSEPENITHQSASKRKFRDVKAEHGESSSVIFGSENLLGENEQQGGNKAIDASAYRKSVTNQKGNADRADGIAYTMNEKPYEISVTKESKPYKVESFKEISDYVQNVRAAKDMSYHVVVSEVSTASPIRVYMIQSISLNLRFSCKRRTFASYDNETFFSLGPNEATVQQYAQPDGSLKVNPQWTPSEQYENHKSEQDYLG
ncbi:hypothetical protein G9A89_015230 [Geosiphon pyriformis]|nr:hypothetical protein G9A89_015230 [Geosiphon pyriformis]